MNKQKDLNILFIGNSHTYCNDMPRLVQLRAVEEGYSCRVTMLAHPNWFLSRHADEPEARFNILYGNALIAPAGENWRTWKESRPDSEMYDEDGAHASPAGSDFAAGLIWETILDDLHRKERE